MNEIIEKLVQDKNKGAFLEQIVVDILEAFPSKKINVFLNAPSIPGINTFKDLENNQIQNKYSFFVGFNEFDEVLLKKKFHIGTKKFKKIRLPRHLSSTSLGCNYKREVFFTQTAFDTIGLTDNFSAGINSYQYEHDFFCYIKQKEFKRNLQFFLAGIK